jgi:hypothetical protein
MLFVTSIGVKWNTSFNQPFLLKDLVGMSCSFGLLGVTGPREVIRKNGIVDQTAQLFCHGVTEN